MCGSKLTTVLNFSFKLEELKLFWTETCFNCKFEGSFCSLSRQWVQMVTYVGFPIETELTMAHQNLLIRKEYSPLSFWHIILVKVHS